MQVEDIKPDLMVHAKLIETPGQRVTGHGVHVGTVDHVDGGRYIKLKRSDASDGKHHWIPLDWVEDVDDKAVYLNRTPDEVARGKLDENPLFKGFH